MTELLLDSMNAANLWTAFESDGVTSSTELTRQNDNQIYRFGADASSLRLTGSTQALGHVLRRALNDVDLGELDEIRFWMRSTRVADGIARPFFLELRLGSEVLPIGDAANTWHRYLPAPRASSWELVRLRLADLPPAIRGALGLVEIRCIDASESFTVHFDDLLAVRERFVADVDAALLKRLHERTSIEGTPVPAIVHHAEDEAPAPALPFIRITPYGIEPAAERVVSSEQRTDFTRGGFVVRPGCLRYDLFFELDAVAVSREQKTALLEFLVGTLTPSATLVQNGVELPVEWVWVAPQDRIGGSRTDRCPLYFKVTNRRELGEPRPVRPTEEIVLEVAPRRRAQEVRNE